MGNKCGHPVKSGDSSETRESFRGATIGPAVHSEDCPGNQTLTEEVNRHGVQAYEPGNSKRPRNINGLPVDDLRRIFAKLQLHELLCASAVCVRWHDVIQPMWSDIIELDLSTTPNPDIAAILRLTPNVKSITVSRKFLPVGDLADRCPSNLSSIKLYDVSVGVATAMSDASQAERRNLVFPRGAIDGAIMQSSSFSQPQDEKASLDRLFATTWSQHFDKLRQIDQLVLHNLVITDLQQVPYTTAIPFSIPDSQLGTLSRLQVSGTEEKVHLIDAHLLAVTLGSLKQLKGLILHATLAVEITDQFPLSENVDKELFNAVESLRNLSELSLAPIFCSVGDSGKLCMIRGGSRRAAEMALKLPKLEVLFVLDQRISRDSIKSLMSHPALRVLLLAGSSHIPGGLLVLPPRSANSKEIAEDRALPFMYIFVHAEARCEVRLSHSERAALILQFDTDLPKLLANEDFREIFEEVWIADAIRETASLSPLLWRMPISSN